MSMVNCPTCGVPVQPGAAYCDNCGGRLSGAPAGPVGGQAFNPSPGNGCPNCGESVLPGEAFCGNCGAALPVAAPVAPPPVAAALPVAVPVAPPPAAAARPMTAGGTCPRCGSPVEATDIFCDNCGQALSPGQGFPSPSQIPAADLSAASMAESAVGQTWTPEPVVPVANPRLIVAATGATLNLDSARAEYLIGREDPISNVYPDVNLVPYGGEEGGVSRRHAQIVRRGGEYAIEDLNSVNYTFVNRQKVLPGAAQPLQDGDEIRLGRVVLQFRLT